MCNLEVANTEAFYQQAMSLCHRHRLRPTNSADPTYTSIVSCNRVNTAHGLPRHLLPLAHSHRHTDIIIIIIITVAVVIITISDWLAYLPKLPSLGPSDLPFIFCTSLALLRRIDARSFENDPLRFSFPLC